MGYQDMHKKAGLRFKTDPSKCYQRHIREVYAEAETRQQLPSLAGAEVRQITNEKASTIILKYEWLRTMGRGTCLAYGLFLNDELLGATCFSTTGAPSARRICQDETLIPKTLCLCRGACVPHAPKNAGSFLVRHSCRLAHRDYGYCVFFAYSDEAAGEVGTIYQAVGWHNIGVGLGRGQVGRGHGVQARAGKHTHMNFIAPDGKMVTSHTAYELAVRLGWTKELGVTKRDFLRKRKYVDHIVNDKSKWVWFEGKDKDALKSQCRFQFLPYPKRSAEK